MALFNEILQGRQQNLLTKLFSMVGGSPAPQLAPEIAPSFELTNIDHDGAALQGVRWCMAGAQVGAGGAGNYSRIGLRNGGNGIVLPLSLLVVRKIHASVATAGPFYIQRTAAPAYTLNTQKQHQDFRITPATPPHDFTTDNATAAAPGAGTCGIFRAVANTNVTIDCHFVLAPIPAMLPYLEVINGTPNDALWVTFEYYYREMTPGELYL